VFIHDRELHQDLFVIGKNESAYLENEPLGSSPRWNLQKKSSMEWTPTK